MANLHSFRPSHRQTGGVHSAQRHAGSSCGQLMQSSNFDAVTTLKFSLECGQHDQKTEMLSLEQWICTVKTYKH
jgi:hypothetical protein